MSGPSNAGAPPLSGVVCNSVLSFVASAQPMQSSSENDPNPGNSRDNEGGQSQNDKVPAGIKAICEACTKLYPDQPNPLQVTTRLKYWLGGDDPLDYISMYWNPGKPEEHIPPHWHYITFGLSDLHGDGRVHTAGPVSGFGFELSFRLEAPARDKVEAPPRDKVDAPPRDRGPPLWPPALCQAIARYVFVTGNKLCPGDHISWHSPLDGASRDSRVRHLLVARDAQLQHIHTPHGQIELLQIVGCTSRELRAAQRGSGFDVLKKMSEDTNAGGAWLVTRMSRRVSVSTRSLCGRPTLAGVQHPVRWIPLQRNDEEPASPCKISANMEQQIKDTLQRGLSAMSADSNSNVGSKMSTDSFQMSSLEKALPEIPETMQGSYRGSTVQYLDGVHVFMNAEGAALLPLAIDGRVLDGSHFTWRGPDSAVTLTAANVTGVLPTNDAPLAAVGEWLQVLLTEDEAKELSKKVAPLASVCQSDSESDSEVESDHPPPPRLPHTVSTSRLYITVLP